MASILDRYGIKEVADVTFYEINADGTPGKPVLYLDTLKVSTIEQTASTADARGGKGNPKLITWDYGKEITVNITDALFSSKSLSILFGNGTVATGSATMDKIAVVRATSTALPGYMVADIYDTTTGGAVRKKIYMDAVSHNDGVNYASATAVGFALKGIYDENGTEIKVSNSPIDSVDEWSNAVASAGNKYFVKYSVPVVTKTITISGDSFPGTYYVTGDTYARSDVDGSDQFFQFIIPKAKMTSENTITLEAEGDPSTYNMNLTVLRPESGEMMKLVQYDLAGAAG